MKHKIMFYTQKPDLIKNMKSIELCEFEYFIIHDASDLFEYNKDQYCMILFDLDSFEGSFSEFFTYLKEDFPFIKLMLIASRLDVSEAVEYLKDGVKGYGSSYMQPVHMQQAVHVICEGNIWIYPELAVYMIQQTPVNKNEVDALKDMNDREKEIINYVCQGIRNKEIAQMLSLSEVSVKKALTQIYHKLHIKDRVEMISLFNRL